MTSVSVRISAWYHNTFLVHLSLGNKVVLYCIVLCTSDDFRADHGILHLHLAVSGRIQAALGSAPEQD